MPCGLCVKCQYIHSSISLYNQLYHQHSSRTDCLATNTQGPLKYAESFLPPKYHQKLPTTWRFFCGYSSNLATTTPFLGGSCCKTNQLQERLCCKKDDCCVKFYMTKQVRGTKLNQIQGALTCPWIDELNHLINTLWPLLWSLRDGSFSSKEELKGTQDQIKQTMRVIGETTIHGMFIRPV